MNNFSNIDSLKRKEYNLKVLHPLQSFEWGEFRRETGLKVIRRAIVIENKLKDPFTLTLHKIPHTKFTIGYLPKGPLPNSNLLAELKEIGKENNCVFIQIEPNIKAGNLESRVKSSLINSFHPLFTKYTFVLDLTKPEDNLLKGMHHKTRYNIKLSEKKGVVVENNNSEKAFQDYLDLTEETTKRQRFFAHTNAYHRKMWEVLSKKNRDELSAHLLTAKYNGETLVAWVVFIFKDTLYYPYGASSSKYRNFMASNLMMWEAIKFGKKMGLKRFDMWGALSKNPNTKDSWYGFHKFKEGYGPEHVEFVGSFDLVINKNLYNLYKVVDKTRWAILKTKQML